MKWGLVIFGFIILFVLSILGVQKMKKMLKQEQDDFQNANHLSKKQKK
jgi:hypothetical protein